MSGPLGPEGLRVLLGMQIAILCVAALITVGFVIGLACDPKLLGLCS